MQISVSHGAEDNQGSRSRTSGRARARGKVREEEAQEEDQGPPLTSLAGVRAGMGRRQGEQGLEQQTHTLSEFDSS